MPDMENTFFCFWYSPRLPLFRNRRESGHSKCCVCYPESSTEPRYQPQLPGVLTSPPAPSWELPLGDRAASLNLASYAMDIP